MLERICPDRVSYTQFVEQRQRLIGVLEEAHRQLPPGGRLVLGGLSQGAALALDVMLHAPSHIDSIAGVFCSRGMMQDETRYNLQDDKVAHRAKRCPIFVFHGKLDHTDQISNFESAHRHHGPYIGIVSPLEISTAFLSMAYREPV